MPALPACLLESLWDQFAALLPVREKFVVGHPLGCHRRRIPDRTVFEHVVLALVHGSFDAEPEIYHWFFRRDGSEVDIRIVMADDYQAPAESGVVLWASRQSLDTLCRAAIRAFDRVGYELGEDSYQAEWRRPFPHNELEGLRTAWRGLQGGQKASSTADLADISA